MKTLRLLSLLSMVAGAAWAQQPTVAAVVNAGSNAVPGLPNAQIAKGAIFIVYGSNLGPAKLVQASTFPLLTTLGGTSVRISAGGTTLNAIMIYTLATQVAAILPSGTP